MFDISDFHPSLSYYSLLTASRYTRRKAWSTQVQEERREVEPLNPAHWHLHLWTISLVYIIAPSPPGGHGWAHLWSLFSLLGQRLAGLPGWSSLTLALGDGVDPSGLMPMISTSILIKEGSPRRISGRIKGTWFNHLLLRQGGLSESLSEVLKQSSLSLSPPPSLFLSLSLSSFSEPPSWHWPG